MKKLLIPLLVFLLTLSFAFSGDMVASESLSIITADVPQVHEVKPLIEEYVAEKYDMDIEWSHEPYHQKREVVTLRMEADKGAYDLLYYPGEWAAGWIEAGYIEELDITPEEAKEDFNPELVDLYTLDGALYALPYLANIQFLYYRTDIFEEKGLEVPDNFNEFKDVAKEATVDKTGDGNIDMYGFSIPGAPTPHLVSEFLQLTWSFDGQAFEEDGSPLFPSPETIEAIEYMLQLKEEGIVPPWILETTIDSAQTDFMEGLLASTSHYPFFEGIVSDPDETDIYDKFGIAQRPGTYLSAGWGLGITTGTDNPEIALDVAKYFTSEEVLKELVLRSGDVPSRPAVLELDEVIAKRPDIAEFNKKVLDPDRMSANPPVLHPDFPEIEEALYTELNKALAEVVTPEEALENAAEKIENILN